MRIAIVYTSASGNTKALTDHMVDAFRKYPVELDVCEVDLFSYSDLNTYDALIIGTYTWGDGDIPQRLLPLYQAIESRGSDKLVTGVYGTGDTFYPNFCGAVDRFRDMLHHHTNLSVTLKVELLPQEGDIKKTSVFASKVIERLGVGV